MNKNDIAIFFSLVFLVLIPSSCGLIWRINGFNNGTGRLKYYIFESHTKREFNIAVKSLFKNYSFYDTPEGMNKYLFIHGYTDLNTEDSRRVNADSVVFHFKLDINENQYLFWSSFVGLQDNWDTTKCSYGAACQLALVGFSKNGSEWKTIDSYKNIKKVSNDTIIQKFESEIIDKISYYLSHQSPPIPHEE